MEIRIQPWRSYDSTNKQTNKHGAPGNRIFCLQLERPYLDIRACARAKRNQRSYKSGWFLCVWVISSLNTRLLHVPMETSFDCVSKVQRRLKRLVLLPHINKVSFCLP